jgi:hypothetical protein
MSVKESAERLRALMIEKCPPLEKRFNPGLSPEECKALAAQYDVVLTQELIDFFGVINGFHSRHDSQGEIRFYYGRWFDTLAEALKHYEGFFLEDEEWWSEYYPEYFEGETHHIPPLRFMGESSTFFYAADLENEGQPVWAHFKGERMSIRFSSLQAMLDELIAQLESGNIYYDADEEWWETI